MTKIHRAKVITGRMDHIESKLNDFLVELAKVGGEPLTFMQTQSTADFVVVTVVYLLKSTSSKHKRRRFKS